MADTVTAQTTTTTPYNIPEFNATLPDAPAYNPAQYKVGQPTYGAPSPDNTLYGVSLNPSEQGVVGAYRNYLGRDPESYAVVHGWSQNPNWEAGIRDSYEGTTLGRARNEINPLVDSQIQDIYNNLGIERQRSQSQLDALKQAYGSQFASLGFTKQQQEDALNALRGQIMQDTDFNAQRLQDRFLPAQQNAYNTANRRGLLNSTVALGLLNQGFQPIQQGLTDLYRSSQRQLSDAEQKRQSILQKYGFDYQDLAQKQASEAKSLQDQLALLISQGQQKAGSIASQRGANIYARAGELGDANRTFGLQQQQVSNQLQEFLAQLAEQQRQFNATPR